jgi:ABC-type antimicrobial peptide transport system permease subunit
MPLDEALAESVRPHRARTVIFAIAGGSGVLLLAVGIAGLVASGVARRVREISIRGALGAVPAQIVRMIVLEHLKPIITGVACGALASWWAARLVGALLYEIEPHDPRVWAVASATLLLSAVCAAWIPAFRAARVDPLVALRYE